MDSVISTNQIICGECSQVMSTFPNNSIDLTVTSPPYDNLRIYNGYEFNFEAIAQQLYRVTKEGGVVVWVVGDATVNGSETGSSFKQALHFKEIGFNLHDTMIYQKKRWTPLSHNRYEQVWEYMFVFSKGKPTTFNPIMRKNESIRKLIGTKRHDGNKLQQLHGAGNYVKNQSIEVNIWPIANGNNGQSSDTFTHPAVFPEELVIKHILSWSLEGNVVLDPFIGSGTTALAAIKLNRNYIGIDISQGYCDLAEQRIHNATRQIDMFNQHG